MLIDIGLYFLLNTTMLVLCYFAVKPASASSN